MALARAWSATLLGVEARLVEVEADLAQGLPGLLLVGLPDTSCAEARDRVRAAVLNSGEAWPQRRITVGLSPATLPKRGSGFDLAVATAVLAAAGAVPAAALDGLLLLGELGLDGRARPVRGVLPAVLSAVDAGRSRVVVPEANAAEAALVPGVELLPVRSLAHLLAVLRGHEEPCRPPVAQEASIPSGPVPDLADLAGQETGRWALEVAAAGGHHLFLHGPPGAGKTMLAERLPGLLPPLPRAQALEVSAVHSVAGALPVGRPLLSTPPFFAPHHTATVAALVGGGSGAPRPGAVSMAHRGVLFLDEAPEFAPAVLDALRQPLESGRVVIARADGTTTFPARFLLVMAANPCPCGFGGGAGEACTCSAVTRRRYLARLSGPLLDRVDIQVEVQPVSGADLLGLATPAEASAVVAARVLEARSRTARRLSHTSWASNAEVPGRALRSALRPVAGALTDAETAMRRGRLTARGVDRVLRVAWTLADLGGRDRPDRHDVRSALFLRTGAGSVAPAGAVHRPTRSRPARVVG